MRKIELLAPAKNLECGIAAINHGADAVYIGAENYGARAAAGNTVDDISKLCNYAHNFNAKVYVTLNTILFDNELCEAKHLLNKLVEAGIDAIIIQDMALYEIAKSINGSILHASTQTDNRNVDKVKWLRDLGFKRIVLARELTIEEIKNIHKNTPEVELEVFIHGALCVSYSGACYASEHCFHRSANRGTCAQFCRLKFDLKDADGNTIIKDKYFLSLKDLARINNLDELLEAGVSSLKIEGRLKDTAYVKNVVASYSKELNNAIDRHPGKYCRASAGNVKYLFTPNLHKTFNRGYTNYFLHGRKPNIASLKTPKAMGEFVGKVKEIRNGSFNVAGTAVFNNGDGLCFINANSQLQGFRINKVVNNRLYPAKMPDNLQPGIALYRNNDQEFERIMSKETAIRKIGVDMTISIDKHTLQLKVKDERNITAFVTVDIDIQEARKPQAENIKLQLSKLGDTHYILTDIHISEELQKIFIPSSILSEIRRKAVEQLNSNPIINNKRCHITNHHIKASEINTYSAEKLNIANVSNKMARDFYNNLNMYDVPDAYETNRTSNKTKAIMTCRYCIRHELGYCIKHGGIKPTWKEPLVLALPDGRNFKLEFDCNQCQMKIYAED